MTEIPVRLPVRRSARGGVVRDDSGLGQALVYGWGRGPGAGVIVVEHFFEELKSKVGN